METKIYSKEDLKGLKKIPKHVAIMMDGNRRWAKKHAKFKLAEGHVAGAGVLQDIVRSAEELGIKVLTVWAFSTDNWKRSRLEVKTLIHLLDRYLKENRKRMIETGVKFNVIGDLSRFPKYLQEEVKSTKEQTKKGKNLELIVALNYGGRDDIKRGIQKIVHDCLDKKIEANDISEKMIGKYLDTAKWGDPDLVIRTSNEMRLSNFLLWQVAYSELYVTPTLWPDFKPKDLLEAVKDFQKREIRKGK